MVVAVFAEKSLRLMFNKFDNELSFNNEMFARKPSNIIRLFLLFLLCRNPKHFHGLSAAPLCQGNYRAGHFAPLITQTLLLYGCAMCFN